MLFLSHCIRRIPAAAAFSRKYDDASEHVRAVQFILSCRFQGYVIKPYMYCVRSEIISFCR